MVDGSSSDRDPVEVLAEEFMERLRQGEHPSIAEYKSRYPQLADDIEDIFPALAMMDEIDPSAGELSQSEPSEDDVLPKLAKLGDYRIIREVGRGGMGVVYEAEQVSLGRHVALKVLPSALLPDSKHVRRFEREAKSAAKLHHTNIVPVFGVGEQDGMHYYVMQFIQGLPLDEVIDELKKIQDQPSGAMTSTEPVEKTGPFHRQKSVAEVAHSLMTGQFAETHIADSDSEMDLSAEAQGAQNDDSSASRISETLNLSGSLSGSTLGLGKSGVQSTPQKQFTYWQSVANIGVQVADALQYAHEQAILHRDIKPSNLLLDLRGTTWVTDFGLAKATDQQDITHTGDILGTLRYMPPEAFDGIADARSDVYSLGLTLYELLVFQPAFGVKERHQLIKQVTTESAPRLDKLNPQIPRDLVTIVHKAIDRDPSHRYQTARDLEEDLQRFIEDEPIKARRISLAERLARWSRRNKGLAASLATVCVLLLIINTAGPLMYLQIKDLYEGLKGKQGELKRTITELTSTRKKLEGKNLEIANQLQEIEISKEELNDNVEKLNSTLASQKLDIYAGDILQVSIEAQRGNLARVREILVTYIPDERDETDLRGPEWYYWWNFLNQSQEIGQINASAGETPPQVLILPGGDLAAVARNDTIQIFERSGEGFNLTGEPLSTVPTPFQSSPILRNPMTASGFVVEHANARNPEFGRRTSDYRSPDDTFHVWTTDGESREFKLPSGALKHLSFMAISPDDRLVAALGVSSERNADPVCRLLVWSVDSGQLLVNLERPGELNRIKFNHDGSLIAAYLTHGSQRTKDAERDVVVVFELMQHGEQTSARKIAVAQHNDDIDSIYFFPDRRELLMGTLGYSNVQRKELYHWKIGEDQPLQRLGDETMPDLLQGAISPDGNLFAVSGPNISTIRLIDIQTGKTTRTLYNSQGYKIRSLTFSSEGDQLIACGRTAKAAAVLQWDLESPDFFALQSKPLTLSTYNSGAVRPPVFAVSPDQRLLAHLDQEGLMLRGREGEWSRITFDLTFTPIGGMNFSPDSQLLAVYNQQNVQSERKFVQQMSLYECDTEDLSNVKRKGTPIDLPGVPFDEYFSSSLEIKFTSDGKSLVKRWGRVHVIDLESKQVTELPLPKKLLQLNAKEREPLFSPLVTDRQTQQTLIAVLEPPQKPTNDDEMQLSAESPAGMEGRWTLCVLDASSGESLHRIALPLDGDVKKIQDEIQEIVLSPRGRRAAIIWKENSQMEIWDLQSEDSVWEVFGNGLLFSSDGSLMTVYSTDSGYRDNRIQTATIWDVAQRAKLSTINLVGTGTDEIRFSPDSHRLLTMHGLRPSTGADVAAEARIWDVRSGHELLPIPVAEVNHYYWDIAFDPASEHLTSLSSIVLGKKSTGRDGSVAKVYDLSRIEDEDEVTYVAEPLVKQLFEDYLLKTEVLSRLEIDDLHLPKVIEKAKLLVQDYPEDDLDLHTTSCLKWIIERRSKPDSLQFQHWAEALQKWYPNDPRSRLIRGIVEYYDGNTDRALKLLAAEEGADGKTAMNLTPEQNLARHAFRVLVSLRAGKGRQAETEMLQMCRALWDDFDLNYFAGKNVELPAEHFSANQLFTLVRGQLDDHGRSVLGSESTPRQMADQMIYVLDRNSDGALTDADCSQDWGTLSRLDSNGNGSVSVDEVAKLMSVIANGRHYPDAAIAYYTRNLQSTPLMSSFWYSRSKRWRGLRKYDRALADCDEALRIAPTFERQIHFRNLRGLVHLDLDDNANAIAEFEEINKLDPDYAPAWNNRGLCLQRQGKDLEAIESYTRAISLKPTPVNVNNRGMRYLHIGDLKSALKDFDELIHLDPNSVSHYEIRGNVQLQRERYDAAIEDFKKALELEPTQNSSREYIVLAYTLAGNVKQAVRWYVKALEHEPHAGNRIELVERLARLELDVTNVIKDRPGDPILLIALARQQSSRGDAQAAETLARAQRLAEEQFDAAPDDEDAARILADVMLASMEPATEWTVLELEPADVTSAGGATLTKLDDGSIRAGGMLSKQPEQEVYTVTARPPQSEVTCVLLTPLPDLTLPRGGSGRGPSAGNFQITRLGLSIQDDATRPEAAELQISRVTSDFAGQSRKPNSWVENMLGRGPGDAWSPWPDVQIPHRVVFELEKAVTIPENGALRITIDSGTREEPRRVLGRFRLSVSNSPNAFREEQKRLAVLKIDDPWKRLAAVYQLLGRETERDALIARRPEAAAGIAVTYAGSQDWPEGADILQKVLDQQREAGAPPEKLADTFRARGELYFRAGQWKEAAADYAESVYLDPEADSLDWLGVATLYAYANDPQGHHDHCLKMRNRFRESTILIDSSRTLIAMLLIGHSFESELDREHPPVKYFMDSLEKSGKTLTNYKWFLSVRAWLACRSDEFRGLTEAQRWIGESKGGPDFSDGGLGLRQRAVQALLLAKQGKSVEAQAQQLVDELTSQMQTDYGILWRDDGWLNGETILSGGRILSGLLVAEILRREAEQLIHNDGNRGK